MTEPNNPPAPVPTVNPPTTPKSRKGKCPNCDAAVNGLFCSSCGARQTPGGAVDDDLLSRVTRLEQSTAPLTKLLDKLRSRGINPENIRDEHLDAAGNMLGNPASPIVQFLRNAFPMPARKLPANTNPPTPPTK